jgi:hypothetical protein
LLALRGSGQPNARRFARRGALLPDGYMVDGPPYLFLVVRRPIDHD